MDEFIELYETFETEARASLFLFCSLVTFHEDTLEVLGEEVSCPAELRSLFKKAKKKAFDDNTTAEEARKLIWFCCQKLLFLKDNTSEPPSFVFDRSTRRELILLADMYIERT
jgi:hypothetical protein